MGKIVAVATSVPATSTTMLIMSTQPMTSNVARAPATTPSANDHVTHCNNSSFSSDCSSPRSISNRPSAVAPQPGWKGTLRFPTGA